MRVHELRGRLVRGDVVRRERLGGGLLRLSESRLDARLQSVFAELV